VEMRNTLCYVSDFKSRFKGKLNQILRCGNDKIVREIQQKGLDLPQE